MKYLLAAIISAVVLIGGIYTGERMMPQTSTTSFGAFTPVQASTFTLAGAGITNSQNTIQLASFALPDPNKTLINMSMFGSIGYAVIEPQTSRIENVSFTGVTQNANGSATLTGVTRGISFYSPFVSSTTLMLSHAGGSNFILSNPGVFYSQFAFPDNSQTWTATQTFGSTTPPTYDADPVWANFSTQVFADVSYVNSVVAAGAANASETVKGIVQLATASQAALGTSVGSTGARLALGNNLATSTPGLSTVTGDIPATTGAFISQLFLNLTQAFTFSTTTSYVGNFGSITATSSARLPANTTIGGLTPLTTVPKYSIIVTNGPNSSSGYATSTQILNIPAGTLTASSTITVLGSDNCSIQSAQTCTFYLRDTGGTTLASCSLTSGASSSNWIGTLNMFVANQSSLTSQASESTCTVNQQSGTVAVNTQSANGVNTVSSFNTANALNLVIVAQVSVGPTAAVSNYSIVVNP